MQYDKIIIDAGHGGKDSGAAVHGTYFEKEIVLRLALALEKELVKRGCAVDQVRRTDVYRSPSDKAKIANAIGTTKSLLLSIHLNASLKTMGQGLEAFVSPQSSIETQIQARNIVMEVVKKNPVLGPLRVGDPAMPGVKKKGFTILQRSKMPAILLELGFLTHPEEREYVASIDNEAAIVKAIADAVCMGQSHGVELVQGDEDPEPFLEPARVSIEKRVEAIEWQCRQLRKGI